MRQRARIVRVMRGRIGSVRRSAITRACLAGLLGGIFPCAAVADFASITVRSIAIKPGETAELVISGRVNSKSAFGVTVVAELVPRPGNTGTLVFTSSPPVDIVQLDDPWPELGTFTPFDTNALGFSPTVNASVDDNGNFLVEPMSFAGPLVSFPIEASSDADGTWDILLDPSLGVSSWEGVPTGYGNGVIVVSSGPDLPAASEWGIVALSLLLLTAGTIIHMRRQRLSV